MVTRIIIARHGNTFTKDQTPLRVGAGTDLPLVETERGTNIGKYLKMSTLIPVAVFAAPLKRTTETARLAIAALDKDSPLIADSRFTEIDYGPDEAKTEDEVIARIGQEAMDAWNANAIVHEALVNAQKTEQEYQLLKKNYNVYRAQVESLVKAQLELLNDSKN